MSSDQILGNCCSGSVCANIVDVNVRRIFAAELVWEAGVITRITEFGAAASGSAYIIPGFIDAHVHIESAMLPPCEFARLAVRHGTIATVSDPHEITNVLGVAGVQFMLENARQTPFHFFFGAPACVPATPYETAGARLESEQLEALFQKPEITYLSEVMNYPGVLGKDPKLLAKLQLARGYGYKIDGHAPGLTGQAAACYAAAGISTDHECSSMEEAEEKLAYGMQILIREGSAARNFEVLHPLISRYPDKVMFCSDDKHPDNLATGHINQLAARAISKGHGIFDVLQCASLNPIRHYGLALGQLRVGDRMDAVLVSDLQTLIPLKTWLAGQLVAENRESLLPSVKPQLINRFNARKIKAIDLAVKDHGGAIRVIKAIDGELLTRGLVLMPTVSEGLIIPDSARDLLMLVVLNRYQPLKPAVAFIQGFGLQQGALASSVAHDSHNIIAVGSSVDEICRAINGIIDHQGGIATVFNNHFDCLPLPIAGLMSDRDGDFVAMRYAELDSTAKRMGSALGAPFMTLSFMALLVIPELKLSDQGLFDSRRFQFTQLKV